MTSYKVVRTNVFDENFKKLDNSIKILILKYLKKLETTANPKAYGKELSGNLAGLYRFRVSNYRIIASIEDEKLVICTLTVGHRSTIYKRFRIL
ncbi:type II toxin-antitoxin system RelE/ParE family toxin [Fusobacterium simiae]|uniref:Type II toxin-antitoxin system RelE/ParE family toxin n=1 Tax=Fusobacterium simiae TaxID=855 RepID=A0ABT4DG89_FUSSI|nr:MULTISPECIES: type II toxin-antitoxin system RelE/ParE family toxin [Fusobacterium]MCY7007607.1 type II toxin-antitoxin system RelE/ParE family toxin [Fusobacterium simiae]QYR67787.1 type II toxin-antitoxin system RelE/ParE family toxin [Fusobacterium animalis]